MGAAQPARRGPEPASGRATAEASQRGRQSGRRQQGENPPTRPDRRGQDTEIHCGKPFLNQCARTAAGTETLSRFGRLSLSQLRRIRDRAAASCQLPAFNTAADEKINGDNRLRVRCHGDGRSAYGKAWPVINSESNLHRGTTPLAGDLSLAIAGLALLAVAAMAVRPPRSCRKPRHRHARRADAAGRFHPYALRQSRLRPRAAGWSLGCSAPSTASIRSSCAASPCSRCAATSSKA